MSSISSFFVFCVEFCIMASRVTIKSEIGDVAVFMTSGGENVRVTQEQEVASRFGLVVGEFRIYEDLDGSVAQSAKCKGVGKEREWYLECGVSYTICQDSNVGESRREVEDSGTKDVQTPKMESSQFGSPGVGENVRRASWTETPSCHVSDGRRDETTSPQFNSRGGLGDSNTHLGSWKDEFLVSVVDSMIHGKGNSRCVTSARKILSIKLPERVDQLSEVYDGDCLFELPPFTGAYVKGAFFLGMERKNDCYLWSRMLDTTAKIGPKLNNNDTSYKIQMVKCLGSLQCMHDNCPAFVKTKEPNLRSWMRDRAGRTRLPSWFRQRVLFVAFAKGLQDASTDAHVRCITSLRDKTMLAINTRLALPCM
jgi:hypothetical protein